MKRLRLFFAILAFCLVSLACATASPYTGPVSDRPTVSIQYLRHLVTDDPRLPLRVETLATASISNPSLHEMTVVLECTETVTTIDLKPRTTEHVLLSPGDKECVIR